MAKGKGVQRLPRTFSPDRVCEALGLKPGSTKNIMIEPGKASVELIVHDDEGNVVVQGLDIVTVFVDLEREPWS
jgi:hypothetical protein